MTRATLDALEAAALAWLDARGAESIRAGRTRWEIGDDVIGPLESIVRAIERASVNIASALGFLRKMEADDAS